MLKPYLGIVDLLKDHFELKEEGGYKFYAKVKSELDKNHKFASDPRNAGIFLFHEDEETKLNTGLFIQLYLESLNEKQKRLFQMAKRPAKKFSIHDFEQTVLFNDSPLGKNTVSKMLRRLCQTIGHQEFTNHSIRSTIIRSLNRMGFQDRTIAGMSGKL